MAEKIDAKPAGSNVTPEIFLTHYQQCRSLKRALEEANGLYRAGLKAAKNVGINQGQLVAVLKAERDDPDQRALNNRDFMRYALWANVPMGTQFAMFSDDQAPKPTEKAASELTIFRAKQDGIDAGRAGHNRAANPHAEGSPTHVAFDEGWLHGQAVIANEMALSGDDVKKAKKPKAESAKDGRKGRQKRGGDAEAQGMA